ncbi:MAG: carboxypeptidase-like regulatory domain-containing protein [Acidobacteriaceae bacterium]
MTQKMYCVSKRSPHTNRHWVMPVLAFCLVVLLSATQLHAQALGGLTGTVTDAEGAVIPGAHVTFRNPATGFTAQAKTTGTGTYVGAALSPGHYTLTVEAPGFKDYVQTDVVVEIGITPTINIQLTPGVVSQAIRVASNSIALETTEPQLGETLEPEMVKTLPIEINDNIRQINSFVALTPAMPAGNQVVFNGIPITQEYEQGTQVNMNPPFEMVDEFRALRSTFSPKYGLGPGAAVTYNMRSGTNSIHGDAYDIYRNNVFDSIGFFPTNFNSAGKPTPPVDTQSDFGFTLGGPVVLPKLYDGRNRTFFLVSTELFAQSMAETAIGTVPTPAEKNGDFSNYVDIHGKQIPIYDPTTGEPFPGNKIPTNRFSAVSLSVIPFIPNPDRTGTIYGQQSNKSPAVTSVPNDLQTWGFTIDQTISQSQSVRYSEWANDSAEPYFSSAPIVPATNELNSDETSVGNDTERLLNYVKTVTPNLVATAGIAEDESTATQGGPRNFKFTGVENSTAFPWVNFNGQNAITSWGYAYGRTQLSERRLGITAVNNWLWTIGPNTFNIGGELHYAALDNTLCNSCAGMFDFSQAETSTPNSTDPNFRIYGSSFASFLLGLPDYAFRAYTSEARFRVSDYSSYIQDVIKASPKLTVDLGLRWDIQVPFVLQQNNGVFLNENALNPGAGNLPGAATMFGNCSGCAGRRRSSIDWKLLGPRLGVDYALNNATVIQAGGFIGYGRGQEDITPADTIPNILNGSYYSLSTGSNVSSYGSWDTTPLISPSLTPFSPSMGNAKSLDYFKSQDVVPSVDTWTVAIQRQLPWDMSLSVDYIGKRSYHLFSDMNPTNQGNPSILKYGALLTQRVDSPAAQAAGIQIPYPEFVSQFKGSATVRQALRPYPQFAGISHIYDMSGSSLYNALEVQGQKRFSNGLSYVTYFTFSRDKSNTNGGGISAVAYPIPLNSYNQAAEYVVDASTYSFNFSPIYELPLGRGQRFFNNKALTGQVLGGWKVGAILQYTGGPVFGVTESGAALNGSDRPNVVTGVGISSHYNNKAQAQYFMGQLNKAPNMFSTSAFARTANQFVLGNTVRAYSALRGNSYRNENIDAMKYFSITDRVKVILRVDVFNAFNRALFGGAVNNISSPEFGKVVSEGTSDGNRQGQYTFRVEF